MRLSSSLLVGLSLIGAVSFAPPPIHVHLIGDSTMAEKPEPAINPERGWGMALHQYFDESVVVRNHALNGRSTKSFIDEGVWRKVVAELDPGDYVFIEFGHNDEKKEDSTRYAAPNTDYERNLERFVREARAKGATPILFTPIVRRRFDGNGRLVDTHGPYLAAVREVAQALTVPLIDLNALSAKLVQDAGPVDSKKLYVYVDSGTSTMYPTGHADDTHLSVRGADAVAKLASDALIAAGLPLASHVKVARPATPPVSLWSGRAPGAVGDSDVDRPSITPFLLPRDRSNGTGVVIYPGGGYTHLATDKEGTAVALWLNGLGVNAFVVTYRLGPRYHYPVMLEDAQRALRLVRANAGEWALDPQRIGVMGFSAGGHMASMAETHFDAGKPGSADVVERVSSRPDFAVLLYPVVTMSRPLAHSGSRANILGSDSSAGLVRFLSSEQQVTANTPPTLIVSTTDDATVPVDNSVLFYNSLKAAKVPAELHLFESGRHGFGTAPGDPVLAAWMPLCESWMRRHGWLPAASAPSR